MAEFKSFKKTMEVIGKFPLKATIEADNPDEEFILLQQKAELEAQLALINAQLKGEI